MASIESKLYYYLLRLLKKKKFLEMQFAFGRFDFYNCKEPPKEIHKACHVSRQQIKGRNVFTLTPRAAASSGQHILYLHGGAYVQNFVKQHWRFLSQLVRATGCTVTAPDYPLAPASSYEEAFKMVLLLYREISVQPHNGNMLLMGDSAGGGFALALAQKIKLETLPAPRKIILLSPWLDITLSNPAIKDLDRLDPFLSVEGLRKAGLAYAKGAATNHFMLSPINGPLRGIGEISIFIGSRDLLVADTRELKKRAAAQGIVVNYREYEDMVHVWMFLGFPEATAAQQEIFDLISDHTLTETA